MQTETESATHSHTSVLLNVSLQVCWNLCEFARGGGGGGGGIDLYKYLHRKASLGN